MSEWIGTFGQSDGRHDRFVRISADSESTARQVMVDHYGLKWAFLYPSEEAAGVEEFGLIETALGR